MLSFKKFKKDTGGNVAMMFGVSALVLMTGIGAAIDYSNLSRAKSELQAQVDAAVLAAARVDVGDKKKGYGHTKKHQAIRVDAANKVIAANGFDLTGINPVLTVNSKTVALRAELDYKPFFGGVLGVDNIRLSAEAESGLPGQTKLDVALVLDSTHSMSVDGKLNALKEGARALVEAIENSETGTEIALVPFSRYVRLNDSVRTESWFQMPIESDHTRSYTKTNRSGGTCTTERRTRTRDGVKEEYDHKSCTGQTETYEDVTSDIESRWDGCVGTRSTPYSETDGSYVHKIPGLLNRLAKEDSGLSYDIWSNCPSELIPLTDDYSHLKSKINGMWSTDNTYLPTGIIWGQRVLSAGVPFDNSLLTGEDEHKKVLVLMTDGNNTTEIKEDSSSVAQFKSPPFIADVSASEIATEANAATKRLCDSSKAQGIEIYTIAFQVPDTLTANLLKDCASSPTKALTADSNSELIAEFERLATVLEADVRLMR